ncbi:hypothetical protein ABGT15_01175 [Flavobacterium enshiense]|uniref:hypothetical protein n=1 Tax=Flavobacterium enshiense TaxID=1341165 RepID=UPI00345CFD4A
MRSSIFVLLLFLVSTVVVAQDISRTMLSGRVVSDSIPVENITIENITAKKLATTDDKGNFRLLAREKDTLVFSGIAFKSSVLLVSHTHMNDDDLKIRLHVRVNELEELIVRPYTLTGNLETDTKNLKVKAINLNLGAMDLSAPEVKYNPVEQGLKSVLPQTESQLTGVNLMGIGKMIAKSVFKSKPKEKKIEFITQKIFSDAVKEKFNSRFFTETLKLKPDEVDLFLAYCDDNNLENRKLLNPKKEFELIDFLLKKSEEYLKKNR